MITPNGLVTSIFCISVKVKGASMVTKIKVIEMWTKQWSLPVIWTSWLIDGISLVILLGMMSALMISVA